jgi:hypothetical protein
MTTDAWPQWKLRPLPRRVSPIQDETTHSYLRRLADANYLATHDLIGYLNPRLAGPGRRRFEISLEALAIISGIEAIHLARALPEIRSQFADRGSLHVLGRPTAGDPNRTCPPCRRCMAAKNITGLSLITIWAPQDQNVCLRHQLWIGQGVRAPEDQLDVSGLPEIAQAQIRHRNLIRRHGHRRVGFFYSDAREVIDWSSNNWYSDTARSSRKRYLFDREQAQRLPWSYDYAAYYPEVVGVLSVLASPYWRRMAISDDPAEEERFYRQVANDGLTNGTPALNTPLRKWVDGHRQHRTADDPDGERYLNRWYFRRSGAVEPPEHEHEDTATWLRINENDEDSRFSSNLSHRSSEAV